jgi:streptogramin lyase
MVKEEIHDTYYIGANGSQVNVLDITYDGTKLYAATEKGVYYADYSNPFLAYFGAWTKDLTIPHPDKAYNVIGFFDGKLFANNNNAAYNDDTLFYYNQAQAKWLKMNIYNNPTCYSIKVYQNKLVLSFEGSVEIYNADLTRFFISYSPSSMSISPGDALLDAQGFVWEADRKRGMLKLYSDGWLGDVITPNGPYSANVYDMDMKGEELWVAGGGRNSTWLNLYLRDGLYQYSDGSWKNHNHTNEPVYDSVYDMVCIAVDPSNNQKAYAGAWGGGMVEYTNGVLSAIYDDQNSSLQGFVPLPDLIFVSGIAFDSQNNLWAANSGAPAAFSVKKADGQWIAYNLGGSASGIDMGNMMVDSYDQKWALLRKDHSLLVFNENNAVGQRYKIIGSETGNGAIPGNRVLCMVNDKDGQVWIGTDAGIAVFYNPGDVLTGTNFDCQRILVEQDGYTQYLLENEVVTCIAIDGANRKWVGTDRAGVFLLSPDGTTQVQHFTEDNSPLLSNSISDIAISGKGEVFIGTSLGIVGFRGDATGPVSDTSEVYAFPNPVPPGYEGTITIKGLPENASVKITDVSGDMVFNTRSLGKQAVWNGYNYDGEKVKTGVYLVFATSDDGAETQIGKILFIN